MRHGITTKVLIQNIVFSGEYQSSFGDVSIFHLIIISYRRSFTVTINQNIYIMFNQYQYRAGNIDKLVMLG